MNSHFGVALPGGDQPWPAAEPEPLRCSSRATRLWRLARVAGHVALGVALAAVVFPFVGRQRRRAHIQRWSRRLLDILGVRLLVSGERPHGAEARVMLVANHISLLDAFAIGAVLPVRFVAKSEMRAWPVMGWLGDKAGTLFIRRALRSDTARIGKRLEQLMRNGEAVAIFPEATTSDGSAVLKFHSSLLQAAILADAAVYPVAIRYVRMDGARCAEVSCCGKQSVWGCIKLMLMQPVIRAELAFLSPITSTGRHRRELARTAREAVVQSLFPAAQPSNVDTVMVDGRVLKRRGGPWRNTPGTAGAHTV